MSFPMPTKVTLEVEGAGYDVRTETYQVPEYAFIIPELSIRVGPLFDGSGHRDEYPDGVIRTSAEARVIAERLVALWNAAEPEHTPEKARWACPCCNSRNVQISLPTWYQETKSHDLVFVDTDSEADISWWYCEDCEESDSGQPTDLIGVDDES